MRAAVVIDLDHQRHCLADAVWHIAKKAISRRFGSCGSNADVARVPPALANVSCCDPLHRQSYRSPLVTFPSCPNNVTVIWNGWNGGSDRQSLRKRETEMKKMFTALASSAVQCTIRKMTVVS